MPRRHRDLIDHPAIGRGAGLQRNPPRRLQVPPTLFPHQPGATPVLGGPTRRTSPGSPPRPGRRAAAGRPGHRASRGPGPLRGGHRPGLFRTGVRESRRGGQRTRNPPGVRAAPFRFGEQRTHSRTVGERPEPAANQNLTRREWQLVRSPSPGSRARPRSHPWPANPVRLTSNRRAAQRTTTPRPSTMQPATTATKKQIRCMALRRGTPPWIGRRIIYQA